MRSIYLNKAAILVFVFCLAINFFGCANSTYPKNENGVILANEKSMDKDALRLEARILERSKVSDDRYGYIIIVNKIHGFGDTFARVVPEQGDTVLLYSPLITKFKKKDLVILDALSPISKEEGRLTLNMIVND